MWRAFLIAAGVLISWGGSMHPGGTMEQMLADPRWLPGHLITFLGFVAMALGIWTFAKADRFNLRGARLVLMATALQAVEMLVHAFANVDLEHLRAGHSTPVLSTHLAMTAAIYPVFGVIVAIWIASTARKQIIASPWIGWLGMAGALMHGAAGFLVVVFQLEWARALFPGVVLLALWLILAGLWPLRAARGVEA